MTTPPDATTRSEAVPSRPTGQGRLAGLIQGARPGQWVKNLACFAGLIFSGKLFAARADLAAVVAFAGFSLAASGTYLLNDVFDVESDRRHPRKRLRAIASGVVSPALGIRAALVLQLAALGTSMFLPPVCRWLLLAYLAMSVAYSYRLKQTLLLDVFLIAIGFVLRVLYGVYAIGAPPSPWIALCMFFLAMFLGFAKRRGELNLTEGDDFTRRPVLRKYRIDLLDTFLSMTAVMAILCYAIYTVIGRSGNGTLVVTVPLVVYAMLRYLFLIVVHGEGDSPERLILSDRVSLAIVGLWVGLCVVILYFDLNYFPTHASERSGPP